MINKNKFQITSNKKLLHKVGKKWVIVSALTLALLGAGSITSKPTHKIHPNVLTNTNNIENRAKKLFGQIVVHADVNVHDNGQANPNNMDQSAVSQNDSNDNMNTLSISKNNKAWDYVTSNLGQSKAQSLTNRLTDDPSKPIPKGDAANYVKYVNKQGQVVGYGMYDVGKKGNFDSASDFLGNGSGIDGFDNEITEINIKQYYGTADSHKYFPNLPASDYISRRQLKKLDKYLNNLPDMDFGDVTYSISTYTLAKSNNKPSIIQPGNTEKPVASSYKYNIYYYYGNKDNVLNPGNKQVYVQNLYYGATNPSTHIPYPEVGANDTIWQITDGWSGTITEAYPWTYIIALNSDGTDRYYVSPNEMKKLTSINKPSDFQPLYVPVEKLNSIPFEFVTNSDKQIPLTNNSSSKDGDTTPANNIVYVNAVPNTYDSDYFPIDDTLTPYVPSGYSVPKKYSDSDSTYGDYHIGDYKLWDYISPSDKAKLQTHATWNSDSDDTYIQYGQIPISPIKIHVNSIKPSLVTNYVNYVYGDKNEGSMTLSGASGAAGNITDTNASGINAGWHLASSSTPFTYSASSTVNVSVAPNTIDDTVDYQVSDNPKFAKSGSVLNSFSSQINDNRAGVAGNTSLNVTSSSASNLPAGYSLASNYSFSHTTDLVSSSATDTAVIVPDMESLTVIFDSGDSVVSSATYSGYMDNSASISVPSNYSLSAGESSAFTYGAYLNSSSSVMLQVVPNTPVNPVKPNENPNSPAQPSQTNQRTITIHYIDAEKSDGKLYGQDMITPVAIHDNSKEYGGSFAAYLVPNNDDIRFIYKNADNKYIGVPYNVINSDADNPRYPNKAIGYTPVGEKLPESGTNSDRGLSTHEQVSNVGQNNQPDLTTYNTIMPTEFHDYNQNVYVYFKRSRAVIDYHYNLENINSSANNNSTTFLSLVNNVLSNNKRTLGKANGISANNQSDTQSDINEMLLPSSDSDSSDVKLVGEIGTTSNNESYLAPQLFNGFKLDTSWPTPPDIVNFSDPSDVGGAGSYYLYYKPASDTITFVSDNGQQVGQPITFIRPMNVNTPSDVNPSDTGMRDYVNNFLAGNIDELSLPDGYQIDTSNLQNLKNQMNNDLQKVLYEYGTHNYVIPVQNTSTVDVNYVDKGTNQVIGNKSFTGNTGSNFSSDAYLSNLPVGYVYVNTINKIDQYSNNSATPITVYMAKPSTIKIQFLTTGVDKKGNHKLLSSDVINGYDTEGFNVNSCSNDVPAGYTAEETNGTPKLSNTVLGNNPTQFTNSNQVVQVLVAPYARPNDFKPSNHSYSSSITVKFMDGTQQVGNSQVLNGQSGQTADLATLSVPSTYTIDGTNPVTAPTFNTYDQTIGIPVKKIQSTITINYVDVAHSGNVISSKSVSGNDGSEFDISQYESGSNLPNGYQFANEVTGNVNQFSKDPQTVDIHVKPISQPTPVVPNIPASHVTAPSDPAIQAPQSQLQPILAPQHRSKAPVTINSTKSNKNYPIQYGDGTAKHPDKATYKGKQYSVHYHANGKNTIHVKAQVMNKQGKPVKKHNKNSYHYKNVVVSTNLPIPGISSPSVIRAVDMIDFNHPVKHVFTAHELNKSLNTLKPSSVVSYYGQKYVQVKVPDHFRYFWVTKDILSHSYMKNVGNTHKFKRILKAHHLLTIHIKGIFAIHSKHANYIRYEFRYKNHNYWVTARDDYTSNAYWQKQDFNAAHAIKRIRVVHNCILYKKPHYNRKTAIRAIHRGALLHIKKVIFIGKQGTYQTRFQLTNGDWITSNKNFVKIVNK